MAITLDELQALMDVDSEAEHLEFKEAKTNYEFENLVEYCVALANEGGGKFILGVTDKRPRQVVGSSAFRPLERTKAGLFERLHIRVEAEEILHPNGRVVVFNVPPRPRGMPLEYQGTYWMRCGDSLRPMTPEQLKRIFAETGPDFSAEVCHSSEFKDLDPQAIEIFRDKWVRKSGNQDLRIVSKEQLLSDAELVVDGQITYAALILLGTHHALGKYLGCAEVIFEYRSSEASLPAQQRKEYRQGFFLFYDDLWNTINLRNEVQLYQNGLFVKDIPTFNEDVVREALLNAISHRDYRLQGSVFVKQYPYKLEIVSPGGFPEGITTENILWKQVPRNRRIAEAFSKCGFVQRSGQGMNRMFEESIKESKPTPDFTGTDKYQVAITLHGKIQDPLFLSFLEKIGQERLTSFSTEDFLAIDCIHKETSIPEYLRERLPALLDQGVIEKVGRTKGMKYILSRRFYKFLGKKGVYTRKRGLDREQNKALLLKHIKENKKEGSQLKELMQVLPALPRGQVQSLLRELREEKSIYNVGRTNGARWYPTSNHN